MKKVSFLVIAILSFNLGSLKAQDIEKGKWYILQEQYGTAKGIFNTLLKSAPNNGKAWYYLGQVYFTLNVPDSAEYCYQKGSTLDPLEPFNFLGLAKMQLNKGNKPDWFKLYDRGRKLAKAKLDYFLEAAESGIDGKVKDYDLANKYLDEAKAVNPKSAKYFIIMGDIDLLRKSPGDAANEYERAVFYDKSSIEAYLKLGKLYSAAKNYRDATNAFNSAVAIDSSQILVYEYLGDLNYTFGKYAEARKYYDIYMHRAENTFENEERYAFIMFFNKDYKEAGELIDKMIQRDPKQSVMYRLKAYIDYENGDYTTGLNEIQHFFEIQDSSKFIPLDYVYYGRLLMKNSQDSLGILKLKKAVDLDSTRYDLYDEIAKTYSRLKKHQDAIDSYNELLKRSNGMAPNIDYQVGKEYYMMAEDNVTPEDTTTKNLYFRDADTAFTKVVQLSPDSYIGYIWRGRARSKLDPETMNGLAKPYYDSAMVLLQKGDTLKTQKQLMECYRYMAFYYYVQADNLKQSHPAESDAAMNNSINYWTKILEMNPADEQAKTALDNLKKK